MLVTGAVLAKKPDFQAVTVLPSGGHASVVIPSHAVEIAPNVFGLGSAQDIDGRMVEGFLFVNNKREDVKPTWAGGAKVRDDSCYKFMVKGAQWKVAEEYITGAGIDTALTATSLETWDSEVSSNIFGERNVDGVVDGADELSPDGKNEVEFADLGPSNTIAYTIVWGTFTGSPASRELVEWDMVFNADYNFGDAGDTDENNLGDTSMMDYQNIAIHELGHALGLGHPGDTCTEETMFRFASYGETKKRTLGTGDIVGVNALYP